MDRTMNVSFAYTPWDGCIVFQLSPQYCVHLPQENQAIIDLAMAMGDNR